MTDRDKYSDVYSGENIQWNAFPGYLQDFACRCAQKAYELNHQFFGLEYWGECWSGSSPSYPYDRHGPSHTCFNDQYGLCTDHDDICVGGQLRIFVYEIEKEECSDLNVCNGNPICNVTSDSYTCSCETGFPYDVANSTNNSTGMAKIIANFEGIELKVYKDTKGKRTVGVGFNMDQPDAKKLFNKYLPGVSFDDVLSGKTSLTKDQAIKLFKPTLDDKVKTTKQLITNYDNLPEKVQIALVNAVFRGELKSTHDTVKLINKGEWDKVADEYLDNGDYRKASKPGSKCRGVKTRMDYNANIFREYAKELKE